MTAQARTPRPAAGISVRTRALLAGGLLLVAVLLVVGLVTRGAAGGDEGGGGDPGAPAIVSADALRAAGARAPLFWAGTLTGTRIELTRTANGRSYVRYLPAGVPAGDDRPDFLTVGTYPQRGAYATAKRSSQTDGRVSEPTPGGGIAVWSERRPSSVYLAYPGVDQLVEVFSPRGAEARRLALAGQVGAVGAIRASEPAPRPLSEPSELAR